MKIESIDANATCTIPIKLENGQDRNAFVVNGNHITAASIIPWRHSRAGVDVLLIDIMADGKIMRQSIGGKVLESDLHWKWTALRELVEETGHDMSWQNILEKANYHGNDAIWREQSKHIYWFHPVDYDMSDMWAGRYTARMSKADAKRVIGAKWVNAVHPEAEGVTMRPDVVEVLDKFMEIEQ